MAEERVVLVDESDREIGSEGKMRAHERGALHRAFSIFVFDSKGRMLIQQRAAGKYHCPGLWTNTCCSHPRPGEATKKAAHRKLMQEMGFDTALKEIFSFTYKAKFSNGLTEHEFDHVFIGRFDSRPAPNPEEASGFRWVGMAELESDIRKSPDKYTPWFRIALPKVAEWVSMNVRTR